MNKEHIKELIYCNNDKNICKSWACFIKITIVILISIYEYIYFMIVYL